MKVEPPADGEGLGDGRGGAEVAVGADAPADDPGIVAGRAGRRSSTRSPATPRLATEVCRIRRPVARLLQDVAALVADVSASDVARVQITFVSPGRRLARAVFDGLTRLPGLILSLAVQTRTVGDARVPPRSRGDGASARAVFDAYELRISAATPRALLDAVRLCVTVAARRAEAGQYGFRLGTTRWIYQL